MMRKLLGGKIHRATVTHADLDYEGSITLAPELMRAAGMVEFEAVSVWNVTNGNRFETYTIAGLEGSTDICVNGAAARLVSPGDIVIIAAFSYYASEVSANHCPMVVFVDQNNRIVDRSQEIAGPQRRVSI